MENGKGLPKSVRLLNTGKALDFDITQVPRSYGGNVLPLSRKCLVLRGIPTDELETEAVVIEIEW